MVVVEACCQTAAQGAIWMWGIRKLICIVFADGLRGWDALIPAQPSVSNLGTGRCDAQSALRFIGVAGLWQLPVEIQLPPITQFQTFQGRVVGFGVCPHVIQANLPLMGGC